MKDSVRMFTQSIVTRVMSTFPVVRTMDAGKVTVATAIAVTMAFSFGMVAFFEVGVPVAQADDVTTSVTVLNTPPVWSADAQESPASSTTTPTNVGSSVTWTATGSDSNAEDYFLLICKTSGSPSAFSNAPPECNGGVSNRWARSATTSSGVAATAATTTIETFPFASELNNWYAWICDANASLARCNTTVKVGDGFGEAASPFVVNHPPVFSAISNDGPVDPGDTITWTATASDTDTQPSAHTVRLFVCKSNDFTGTACGAGGTWATSTLSASNPATTTTISIPTQDATYNAYVYVMDNYGLVATSTVQGSNSTFNVSNVAPAVTAATVSLVDTDNTGDLTLLTPYATTGPFKVQFEATDNNSCAASPSGNEISSAIINVYRSGITSAGCDQSGEFNTNNCYTASSTLFAYTCTQDGASCSGSSDTSATWTCTFDLWYNADPTDASTQYTAQNWMASVRATDNNATSSALTEGTTGNELTSFLAFNVTQTAISFGSLEPGQQNDPLSPTTDLIAIGNVGLDQDLYGDTMCTTWTAPDSCDSNGINAANDIPVSNQKFATSAVAYASSQAYTLTSSTTPTSLSINVQKTTSTSSPQTKDTYWGINIPVAITLAGNYSGQNTITAKKSPSNAW